jgi:molybdopterin molybdotransferase
MTKPFQPHQASCKDDYDPNSLSVDEALLRIDNSITPKDGDELLPLTELLNRINANDIHSAMNVPSFTNSAMDGYAIDGKELPKQGEKTFTLAGTVLAGAPLTKNIGSNECARIMTGAKIPSGTDTVIMQEQVRAEGDNIFIGNTHQIGQNVRHIGEDIKTKQLVLKAGRRFNAADIGLLASLGIKQAAARPLLKVAFFSTGDELVSLNNKLQPGQIYDSNRYTLIAMLNRFGATIIDMGVVKDNRESIESAFNEASNQADVLITTGGVSVGDADYVKEALEKLGNINFWKIAMKPGRPLAYGKLNTCHFFGLPGNPVSSMVTFYQFVLPALKKLQSELQTDDITLPLKCTTPIRKNPGRVEYQRGIMEYDSNGELVVRTTGGQGSHMLSSMVIANCFIILPMECKNIEAGDRVKVQPFAGII